MDERQAAAYEALVVAIGSVGTRYDHDPRVYARMVRDAIVAGHVHGVMHAGDLMEASVPPDSVTQERVLRTARAMPDLYPALSLVVEAIADPHD